VADEIHRALATLIQRELRDPRLGLVTVTAVEVSPDLRQARVWVTSLLGQDPEGPVAALEHAAPFLRRELAHVAGLRFTPELRFIADRSTEQGLRVERLLDEVRPADEPSAGAPASGSAADEPADDASQTEDEA
jgi:ribosome-binding factor A